MSTYKLHWKHGDSEIVRGSSPEQAMTLAGYSAGALAALDYYEKLTPDIEQYDHHGKEVSVMTELKGLHREHCLCYVCQKFEPGSVNNCQIAQDLFQFCVKNHVVTPVYECHVFCEKED